MRLEREGWATEGGGEHDKYVHRAHPATIIAVPRHRECSPGVARKIAKQAGWR